MWEIQSCQKGDECYPKTLRDMKSAPDILYYVGDIAACENVVIAVVGKRDAAERYLEIAKMIGGVLANKGFTVLNGLAIGVDAYALEGALEANGKVVAVMPGGLDEIYPKSNQKLAERIVENGGCLISEYPNGTRPQKYTFVQRDDTGRLKWLHVMISNIKANIEGAYHGLDGTYLQRYLDEFCYRFNRRWSKKPVFDHLLECCVWAPYRTVAEVCI